MRARGGSGRSFASFEDARLEYELGNVDLRAPIRVRDRAADNGAAVWHDTTMGRIIFNEVLPEELGFRNEEIDKTALKDITGDAYRTLGNEGAREVLDAVKGHRLPLRFQVRHHHRHQRRGGLRREGGHHRAGRGTRSPCWSSSTWTA